MSNNSLISVLIKSSVIGILAFVIMLAIFSIVIMNSEIASHNFFIMVLVASGIAAIVSSLVSSIFAYRYSLITGMLAVIIITSIQFLILLCLNNADLSMKVYLMFPINFVAGFIGCVAGTNIIRK